MENNLHENRPSSVDETPETTKILARIMEEDGEIDEYNAPCVWVSHSRKMERERKMMMDRSMGNAQSVFELGEKLAKLERERDNLRAKIATHRLSESSAFVGIRCDVCRNLDPRCPSCGGPGTPWLI